MTPQRKRASLMKQADALCSRVVKLRDQWCQRCGSTEYPQWSHHLKRAPYYIIRHDLMNSCVHCRRCHMYLTQHPVEHRRWIRDYIGDEALQRLEDLALVGGRPDYRAIIRDLTEEMRALEEAA